MEVETLAVDDLFIFQRWHGPNLLQAPVTHELTHEFINSFGVITSNLRKSKSDSQVNHINLFS